MVASLPLRVLPTRTAHGALPHRGCTFLLPSPRCTQGCTPIARESVHHVAPRRDVWRRCCLGPMYFFAGLSKIRYLGFHTHLSGKWLIPLLKRSDPIHGRAAWPVLGQTVLKSRLLTAFMSWGNVLFELLLAPAIFWFMRRRDSYGSGGRLLLTLVATSFHVLTILMLGPNFLWQILLVLLAANILAPFPTSRPPRGDDSMDDSALPPAPPIQTGDRTRGIVSSVVLLALFGNQLDADWRHIRGSTPLKEHFDRFWPVTEYSMFTYGQTSRAHFVFTSCFALAVLGGLTRMALRAPQQQQLPEARRGYLPSFLPLPPSDQTGQELEPLIVSSLSRRLNY